MRSGWPALAAVAVAAVSWPIWESRGYPWQLVLVSALAVGALTYISLRTLQRLRLLVRLSRDGESGDRRGLE